MSEAQQDVIAELEDQLRSRVIAAMGDPNGDLAAMRTVDVLGRWFNWQDRLISPRPRAVHDSAELLASKEAQGNAADLAQIRSEIESGADLTPRLSTRARTAYTPTSDQGPLQRRRDLDLLLSDWGIHHLHLAHAPQRSGLLLFVVFRPDDAYLLQLLPHGSWAKESLVEIIVRNWPDAGLMMGQLKGAIGLSQPISEADRQKLRGAGVSTLVEVDGGMHVARVMSTAGTSISSTMRGDQIMRALQHWRQELSSDRAALDAFVRSRGHTVNGVGVWQPYIHDREFGFIERTAALRIPVGLL